MVKNIWQNILNWFHNHNNPPIPTPLPIPIPSPINPSPIPNPIPGQDLITLVNEERQKNGLLNYLHSPILDQTASDQVRYISTIGTLTHIGLGGSTPDQRIRATGLNPSETAENAAMDSRGPTAIVMDWMTKDPQHRAILLSATLTHMGYAISGSYCVADFCQLPVISVINDPQE